MSTEFRLGELVQVGLHRKVHHRTGIVLGMSKNGRGCIVALAQKNERSPFELREIAVNRVRPFIAITPEDKANLESWRKLIDPAVENFVNQIIEKTRAAITERLEIPQITPADIVDSP